MIKPLPYLSAKKLISQLDHHQRPENLLMIYNFCLVLGNTQIDTLNKASGTSYLLVG